ncbi:hypothetical protein ACFX1X_002029 [Malus domestica]
MLQFIPYSFAGKEASHVGISTCDHRRRKELEQKRVVLALIVALVEAPAGSGHERNHGQSHVHPRANVTRWEMRTKPFVRTLEFLWQEGHNRNICWCC